MRTRALFWILLTCTIVLPLGIYTYTLAPGLTFGDSGELITAAYYLGIPHPHGFPFWVLLTKLFTYIPISSIAWRTNFASAVYAAAGIGILFTLGSEYLKHEYKKVSSLYVLILAGSFSMLLAFTASLWSTAVVTEVYSLLFLISSSVLLLLFRWHTTHTHWYLYTSMLLIGFGITTHYLALTIVPAVFVWLICNRKYITLKQTAILIGSLLLGLSVFFLIPLRMHADIPIVWGNMDSMDDVVDHIRRAQFKESLRFADTNAGIYLPLSTPESASAFVRKVLLSPLFSLRLLAREFSIPGALLGLFGMGLSVYLIIRKRSFQSFATLLLLLFISSEFVFDFLTVPVEHPDMHLNKRYIERLLPFSIMALWIAYAVAWIYQTAKPHMVKHASWIIVVCAVVPIVPLVLNFSDSSMRGNTVAYDHGVYTLTTMDEGSTLFVDKNDWLFPLLYLTAVEHVRSDITIYDRTGNLYADVYNLSEAQVSSDHQLEQYRSSVDQEIIKADTSKSYYYAADKDFEQHAYPVAQEGILYKHTSQPTRTVDFYAEYESIMSLTTLPWTDHNVSYIVPYYHMRYADQLLAQEKKDEALAELHTAVALAPETYLTLNQTGTYFGMLEELDTAEKLFRDAIRIRPSSKIAQRNLGIVLSLTGNYQEAIEHLEYAYELDPQSPQTIAKLVEIYQQLENTPQSLIYMKKLYDLTGDPTAAAHLVSHAATTGNCKQAEDIAFSLDPSISGVARLINNVGVCWAKKEQYGNARNAWEIALKIDPNYSEAANNLQQLTNSGN